MSSGIKAKKIIRVAFLSLGNDQWAGGLHYLRNLLYAVSTLEERRIEPVVFVGTKVDERLIAPIKPYAEIIRTSMVERRRSVAWFVWKIFFLLTGSNYVLNRFLRRHNIHVVSHSHIWGRRHPYKLLNWIPDFQHLHLPEMFSKNDAAARSREFAEIIKDSDCLILSSKNAGCDLCEFMPGYEDKIKILNFVSQPDIIYTYDSDDQLGEIEAKYGFQGKYFYLPNQFWRHKNHRTVFEAVNILRQGGVDILLLCSGHMEDYRNHVHVNDILGYIGDNKLKGCIKLLGLIDYADVFTLMRYSIAVINPSLSEGWSSTVEEAKSMGKGMILSDIPVHREQAPPATSYFKPDNPAGLADVLKEYWLGYDGGVDRKLEAAAIKALPRRTHEFGKLYQDIVLELSET